MLILAAKFIKEGQRKRGEETTDAGENRVNQTDVALVEFVVADKGQNSVKGNIVHRIENNSEQEIENGDANNRAKFIGAGKEKDKEERDEHRDDADAKPQTGFAKTRMGFLDHEAHKDIAKGVKDPANQNQRAHEFDQIVARLHALSDVDGHISGNESP